MIVGLTGKSCSGKNRVAELLDDSIFTVIDEDKIGHDALSANVDKIREAFGDDVIGADNSVDRKKLGPIVFSSAKNLETLNSISHPWMVEKTLEMAKEIEESGKVAVINAAILESMGFVEHCNEVLLVISDYENRLKRAMSRDGITKEAFDKRASAQKNIGESLFASGKKVITIINNGTEEALSRQIKNYCDSIKK